MSEVSRTSEWSRQNVSGRLDQAQPPEATIRKWLQDIESAQPVDRPSDETGGDSALLLPHGCVLKYCIPQTKTGEPKVAHIRWIFVPDYLRGRQQEGAPSIGERLVGSLRDSCAVNGISRVDSVMTHPGGLSAVVRTFGAENVTMIDEGGQQLASVEQAIDYLQEGGGNADVLARARVKPATV